MPQPVKAVLVTMFEPDGHQLGELTPYRKQFNIKPLELSGCGLDHIYATEDMSLIALVAGVGTANTAVSLMALGLCPEIDLRKTNWLISGIAGVNPNEGTLGSVYWTDWIVDGDLAHEVDIRSAPDDWPIGIFPLGASEPYGPSSLESGLMGRPYQRFQLNPELLAWAWQRTRELELSNPDKLKAAIEEYAEYPATREAPKVDIGASLSAARFWHGPHHNEWAEKWVDYWTNQQSRFITSGMEDTGTLQALSHLNRVGRVSMDRVLVLRGASNFTTPPQGKDAVENLIGDAEPNYPGMVAALDNLGLVGGTILKDWINQPD
ncbi:MAG: purine nucleoside permease [Verrucomicrobiota bacterium]